MSDQHTDHESQRRAERAVFDEAVTASMIDAERHARGEWTPEERAELVARLARLQAPADVCPTWCRHDELDEDGMRVHAAVLGYAGPLEVSIYRSVPASGEPIDEFQLHDYLSTSAQDLTIPLDGPALVALAELVAAAADAARQT